MIKFNDVSKEFGGRILFDEVDFAVNPGERVGLIGRNGSGKSTLFKLITGELEVDSGEIQVPNHFRVAMLDQYIKFSEKSVLKECCLALSDEEKFDDYKAEKILSGLGFSDEDMKKDPQSFSGGFQIRINLVKCLLKKPDLLLLDEPTNYLDIVSMRWLKSFLISYPAQLILITHDREFMNDVCTHTVGIHRKKLKKIKGSTYTYKEKIAEEELVHENSRLNQEKKKKEIEAFITRFRAKASKATLVSSRVKMLERMQEYDELENISNMNFKFNLKPFNTKRFFKVEDLSFGYEENKILFKKLNFELLKGERVGIIGKNGKGKSTLLNLLSKDLIPVSGELNFHDAVETGFFGQTNISRLNNENTIAEEIASMDTSLTTTQIRNICATMMFTGDDAAKKIKVLSGGEKSRVLLGKILTKPCNLLLLDEPTNHLDQESVEAMSEQLLKFEGGLVFVTHSEWLLKQLATKLVVFHEDNAEVFHGTYDEFLEKIGWGDETLKEKKEEKVKLSHREIKRLKAELITKKSHDLRPLKSRKEILEKEIDANEKKLKKSQEDIVSFVNEGKSKEIQDCSILIKALEDKIENDFEELVELEEKIALIEEEYRHNLEELL